MAAIDIRERQFDYGPQRGSWLFEVRQEVVKAAAERRRDYHASRRQYWEAELTQATEAVKDSTEIRQHQVTGGVQVTATIDQEKGQYMTTCQAKVASHRAAELEYAEWAELLGLVRGIDTLHLTITDAQYFRLNDRRLASEFDE